MRPQAAQDNRLIDGSAESTLQWHAPQLIFRKSLRILDLRCAEWRPEEPLTSMFCGNPQPPESGRDLIKRTIAAFTLIELLVVIAIIAILAALLLPSLKSARDSAIRIQCINNLKQHGITVNLYCDDNGGFFPNNSVNQNPQWRYLWGLNTNAYSRYFPAPPANYISNLRYNGVDPNYICPAFRRRLDNGQFDSQNIYGFHSGYWNAAQLGYWHTFFMSSTTPGRFLGGLAPSDVGHSTPDSSGAPYQAAITSPSRCVMIYDAGFFPDNPGGIVIVGVSVGHPNGWSALLVDGHAKFFTQPNNSAGNNNFGCGLQSSLSE